MKPILDSQASILDVSLFEFTDHWKPIREPLMGPKTSL